MTMPVRGAVNVLTVAENGPTKSGTIGTVDAVADLADRIHALPRRRTYLLPALHEVQHVYGWLPPDALEIVGAHLRVPKSEVFGIASSFPDFAFAAPPVVPTTRVCLGAACRTANVSSAPGGAVADCLFACGVAPVSEIDGVLIGRGGRHSAVREVSADTRVQDGSCSRAVADTNQAGGIHVGCAGNCWQAPAVSPDGGTTWLGVDGAWTRPGEARLLVEVGRRDPFASGPYRALEHALTLGSDGVWKVVRDAGLRGRGGAYFPVASKWETARNTPAGKKFLLVNAEEGEPGIYKDRHLLEGDPHRVLEGVLIAALGIGATDVVLFVNGEAHLSQARLSAALAQARDMGVVQVPVEI
ncbi:MAG TPA: NAD(P)H-dependent oxidoreductase subunit E, partial [Chloroflexota bacterium]|nr:NAD(P)H-dependent oxidoreductase subunit E [Chloroflexota bacterium]